MSVPLLRTVGRLVSSYTIDRREGAFLTSPQFIPCVYPHDLGSLVPSSQNLCQVSAKKYVSLHKMTLEGNHISPIMVQDLQLVLGNIVGCDHYAWWKLCIYRLLLVLTGGGAKERYTSINHPGRIPSQPISLRTSFVGISSGILGFSHLATNHYN